MLKKKTKEIDLARRREKRKRKTEGWAQREEEPVEYVELSNPAVAYVLNQDNQIYAGIYADSAEEAEKGALEIGIGMDGCEAGQVIHEFGGVLNIIIDAEDLGDLERNDYTLSKEDSTFVPAVILSGVEKRLETLDDHLFNHKSDDYQKVDRRKKE